MRSISIFIITIGLLSLQTAQAQWIYQVINKETNEVFILRTPPEGKLDDKFHLIKIPDKRKQKPKSSGLPIGNTETWDAFLAVDWDSGAVAVGKPRNKKRTPRKAVCPDGSYVTGLYCRIKPNGTYFGTND